MKLAFAVPVLGALALVAAMPNSAEARSRSSFDISVGFGYSSYGGSHRYYDRGHYYGGRSYYRSAPRYYSPRPYYRDSYYYRPPVRSYRYYDDCNTYYRPVYRPRYYYRDSYYCD